MNYLKRFTSFFTAVCTAAAMIPFIHSAEASYRGGYIPAEHIAKAQIMYGSGDTNGDGELNISDAVILQRYLLGEFVSAIDSAFTSSYLVNTADMNFDGCINAFDMVLMKQALVSGKIMPSPELNKYILSDTEFKPVETVVTSSEEFVVCTEDLCFDGYSLPEYDESFFEDNILLLKTIVQPFGDEILYNLSSFCYSDNNINVACDLNYSTYETYTEKQLPFLAAITVPAELYHGENINWNIGKFCWDDIFDLIFPTQTKEDTFEFISPDGSQTFRVEQSAEYNKLEDCGETTLRFYVDAEYRKFLKGITLHSEGKPYLPFGEDGSGADVLWDDNTVTFKFAADKEYSLCFDYFDHTPKTQTISINIRASVKPELIKAELTADCFGELKYKAKIKDAYNINTFVTGTKGMVGIPVEFTVGDDISNAKAVFHYDESELRWVDEHDLAIKCYSTEYQRYAVIDSVCDYENNTITFEVTNKLFNDTKENLIYLMYDSKHYSRSEKEKLIYTSDWERGHLKGSIMKLCNKEWAIKNAPDLRVSDPEQLASAVWYVNSGGYVRSVTLEDDIDLSGYEWVPMGWRVNSFNKQEFNGILDGNGHTIKNMTINGWETDAGFIGIGAKAVKDITFENAVINYGLNVGIVCGNATDTEFINVHASGRITSSSLPYVGAICGNKTRVTFTNCSADVYYCDEPLLDY